ncbi:dTDP-4-dehydrorhamnose reductase family protein [Paenibacillus planticolens]|uniref:dTDP-4-dehydrorhamnose reductase n=1 Tax=Paenibacillus planticolens TaxID=2654976 RepID=A0ABX1ZWM5_9BACL|nr:SDR family oxidoreductase [Paenibacillus planticolens]NOV04268.1 sugar nucleotide-binding protein [Paenibacillus planticolens]
MKLLIIGGHGMAGHMLRDYFARQHDYEVWTTVRSADPSDTGALSLDVRNDEHLRHLLNQIKPDAVINAAGLLNEEARTRQAEAIYVNSLFPHQLAMYAEQYLFRLFHISTDCVFSGSRGDYTEWDPTDALSVYGKSKSLGEVYSPNAVTIRTSIIGPELKQSGIGLFHWFMQQKGDIQGYRRVFWNGVTTLELAKAIEWCFHHPIHGLVHLAGQPKLSKYELLLMLQQQFHHDAITIHYNDDMKSDKSLVSTRADFTYPVSSYPQMIADLHAWMNQHQPH